jgi:hypothetical protein
MENDTIPSWGITQTPLGIIWILVSLEWNQSSVFIEKIQFEISRASRKLLVKTNYDATSCYDSIVPNLAMLASQSKIWSHADDDIN